MWGSVGAKHFLSLVSVIVLGASNALAAANDPPPPWAFPVDPPKHADAAPAPKKPEVLKHVTGSKAAFTDRQLDDFFFTTDWFPGEHPAMPAVVASGRKPAVWACTFCHLPSGAGGPAEAALPGLPAGYIVEQLQEFRAGRRKAAQSQMESPQGMEREARALSDAEIDAAAKYFSQLPFKSRFHVIETDTVPKTAVRGVSLYAKIPGGGSEALGKRIVEVPDDFDDLELGDPHADITAYVPKGSIRRGAALVASGDGAAPCSACHGVDFKGIGNVPPLAGRSASYIVRQLYDIQHGTRHGPAVAPMQPEVAHMTADDRIAIAAYLTSLR